MPTETLAAEARPGWWRGWPEALVGLLAAVIFLGCLGSVDIWGKREQRASAEVLDTVEHHHWLVAEIQGRPRLEKPPLPRWIIAALMLVTGRRDEWIVRLPGAAFALGTVGLVYLFGRRLGGRAVGLASALILCSSGLFVGEMRQAGNDGPLAFFTTLALYAAWCVLQDDETPEVRSSHAGRSRFRRRLFYAALGLGFLCKGPIVLMLTSAAIVPYLIQAGRLRSGLRRLADAPGLLILVAIATSWPASVAWHDPNAVGVWLTEMSEKTGLLGTLSHRRYASPIQHWPDMTFPWSIAAMAALILPFLPGASPTGDDEASGRTWSAARSPVWFAWWWAVGNMGIFCLWAVAKPYYYLPCTPAMALLAGEAWVRLARRAHGASSGRGGSAACIILQAQWILLFVGGVLFPIAVQPWLPRSIWPWTIVPAAALAAGVIVSARAWRGGSDAMALAPIVAALALGVVVVYGILAPAENPRRSHRELAGTIGRRIPPGVHTIHFYNQVDEGLWFYLRDLNLAPVPGTHPCYSSAYDLAASYQARRPPATVDMLDARREDLEKRALLRWLDDQDPSSFLLIRSSLYDRYARELSGRVRPVFREAGLSRNELVLLRTDGRAPLASSERPIRR
jgi:4-amino-4-deoxy-L-arabinose transferase-like glycosyltransferase